MNTKLQKFANSIGLQLKTSQNNRKPPRQQKNIILHNPQDSDPFPAIHELAHALCTPVGQTVTQHFKTMPFHEHLIVYEIEVLLGKHLRMKINPCHETLLSLAIECLPGEFETRILPLFPKGTPHPRGRKISETLAKREYRQLTAPYRRKAKQVLAPFLRGQYQFTKQGKLVKI